MPIYEYHCKKCGAKFEKLVFRSDAPSPECPSCKSTEVAKLISVPSVGGGSGQPGNCQAAGGRGCASGFS